MKKYFLLLLLGYCAAFLSSCQKEDERPRPTIAALNPASGPAGSTVTITGSNFSETPAENRVGFNGVATVATAATPTELTVIVPSGASTGKVTVSVKGGSTTSQESFTMVGPPTLSEMVPLRVRAGGIVTLKGSNFNLTPAENVVKINGMTATVLTATAGELSVRVPAGATTGKVSVTIAGTEVVSLKTFVVLPPATITTLSPSGGDTGLIFTIKGTSFSTTTSENSVKVNGTAATVLAATDSLLTVAVPAGASSGKVTVTVTGQEATSPVDFTVETRPGQWTKKGDFAGTARAFSASFSVGNRGYLVAGSESLMFPDKKDVWEYNPDADTWTQKADFDGPRNLPVAFAIGSKGYVGAGWGGVSGSTANSRRNDFWEYDPATNAWIKKANCPLAVVDAVGFSIGNIGYVGTGSGTSNNTAEVWSYDPATNLWSKETNFGGTARSGAIGFGSSTKGYIGLGFDNAGQYKTDLWEYSPFTGQWTQKADFPAPGRYRALGFGGNGKGYVSGGSDGTIRNDFYEYDPATNAWTAKRSFPGGGRLSGLGMAINNKIYVGNGYGEPRNCFKDFWVFTP